MRVLFLLIFAISVFSCKNASYNSIAFNAVKPVVITEKTAFDTDDPAIWINPTDVSKSLIVGTDKETEGGLYVYDLNGKIVNKFTGMKRPNNVDIAYDFRILNGQKTDIAVATERETNKIRVFSLPDLKPIDNGGIDVFADSEEKSPMGIALYTRTSDSTIFAIVGRKTGPENGYLYQYRLEIDSSGIVQASIVRKFGKYSGKKEIESIAVDNELGYVYYSDEQYGVHKYYADPDKGNEELALFGQKDFKEDLEGISIYKHNDNTGYILVSNQQANSFIVYKREGATGNPNLHTKIAEVPVSTIESDGSDVSSVNFGVKFPQGLFVAMSNGKVFHYYDWRDIQSRIDSTARVNP